MATFNDRAQACADVLDDLYANRPAADMVRLLAQQRAELLEALKRIEAAASANAYSNVEWIARHAREAITKAEAAE